MGIAYCDFKEMQHLNIKRDVVSYSAAISACEKGADWVLPFVLFKEMRQWNRIPNVVSCSTTRSACEKRVKWLYALKEVRQWKLDLDIRLKAQCGFLQHRNERVCGGLRVVATCRALEGDAERKFKAY